MLFRLTCINPTSFLLLTIIIQVLDAKRACKTDDVLQKEWSIKFINCQMLLKGTESKGYLIISAAKAEALRTAHSPVWKDETLLSKSCWSGALENMQYFATVVPPHETNEEEVEEGFRQEIKPKVVGEQIMWVPKHMIENNGACGDASLLDLSKQDATEDLISEVGANASVGGVISNNNGDGQLQRVVSRSVLFLYANPGLTFYKVCSINVVFTYYAKSQNLHSFYRGI